MLAYRTASSLTERPGFCEVPIPKLKKGQALVKLKYAALNRRDYKIWTGNYANYKHNCTMGSDGFGCVVDVFDFRNRGWKDRQVIINPNINWGNNKDFPSESYEILGMPTDGTFAEYIAVDVNRLAVAPDRIDESMIAAIPLASITAYSVLFGKAKLSMVNSVLITGAGGGVSQMAIKMAISIGAKVYTTSSSKDKLNIVKKWGDVATYLYTDSNWVDNIISDTGGVDVIIDSSGGNQINQLLQILNKNGKLIIYGATNGVPQKIDLLRVYYKQLMIQGSLMGSDNDFSDMLSFIEKHNIAPKVDSIIEFEKIELAFQQIGTNRKMGKIVLKF